MNTSSQPRGKSATPTILLVLGGILTVLAVIFVIILYIWGRSGPTYGENWNDVISAIFIVYGGIPVFVIGLVLLSIGFVLRARRARA